MHSRTTELKKMLRGKTLEQKMESMRDFYKDEHALLFSCGPSFDQKNVSEIEPLLKNHLVVSVKQTYTALKPWADFHLINWVNQQKYHYDNKTILVGEQLSCASRDRLYGKKPDLLFTFDPASAEKAHDRDQWLIVRKNFDDFLISRNLYRPMGPGIMIELAFYLLLHLGVKTVTCVGWDVSKQDANASMPHFYDESKIVSSSNGMLKQMVRPALKLVGFNLKKLKREYLFRTGNRIRVNRVLPNENESVWEGSFDLYEYFKTQGLEFRIASTVSWLDQRIPRVNLKSIGMD